VTFTVFPWFISLSCFSGLNGRRKFNRYCGFSGEYGGRQCNSGLDCYNTTVGLVLSHFFIKPKLQIGTEIISPQLATDIDGGLGRVTRKWLKIRVVNIGGAIATNCRADLDVTPVVGLKHPRDSKRLIWDDGSEEKNIRRKDPKGEILRVAFYDSFPIGYVYAMSCTKEAEISPSYRAQDGFESGDFEMIINISTEDGRASIKKTFRLHAGKNMDDFSMISTS
jgi:hypothetical protein